MGVLSALIAFYCLLFTTYCISKAAPAHTGSQKHLVQGLQAKSERSQHLTPSGDFSFPKLNFCKVAFLLGSTLQRTERERS